MVKLPVVLGLAFFVAFLKTGEGKTLLCAKCSSKKELYRGECQNDPPPPSRCSGGSSVEQFCIIVQEYAKNGTLLGFIRDCSATATESKCRELKSENPKSPAKVCVKSCKTPGCNSAMNHGPPAAIFFVVLLICDWMWK